MCSRRSGHFSFDYTVRTPFAHPRSETLDGDDRYDNVPNERYVKAFEEALKTAWSYYRRKGWPLPERPVEIRFKDQDEEGLTTLIGDNECGITFRARHEDGAGPCNRSRAECAAAHELFHVVQAELKRGLPWDPEWVWFGEATAAYMVGQVFEGNRQPFLPLDQWFDEPDRPLTDVEGDRCYGSFIFCKYLNDRFPNADVVKEIWDLAPKCKSALAAISRCLRGHTRTPFASAVEPDLFCNEFLAWNFFFDLWKGRGDGGRPHGYADGKMLRRRFQHAFAGDILLPDEKGVVDETFPLLLDPLAGCYHLLRAPAGTRRCRVTLTLVTERSVSSSPGKGVVFITRRQRPCGPKEETLRVKLCDGDRTFRREKQVPLDCLEGKEGEVLLIVANTAWRKPVGIAEYTVYAKFE